MARPALTSRDQNRKVLKVVLWIALVGGAGAFLAFGARMTGAMVQGVVRVERTTTLGTPSPWLTIDHHDRRYHFRPLRLSFALGFVALAAGYGLWRIARWELRRARLSAGHCPECAYDLRATPEPGGSLLDRCPECGSAISHGDSDPAVVRDFNLD